MPKLKINTGFKVICKVSRKVLTLFFVGLFVLTSVTAFSFTRARIVGATQNTTINFQARLLQTSGAIVPDGNYHVEFKLYNASSSSGSSQGSCSGDANCLWTETRTTGNLVRVVNGYLTVNLGSVTAFGSTIKWDQNLWLTMNVGGISGSPSWDGEMSPRLKLTAVPYAFRASNLYTSDETAGSTNSSAITIQSGNASGATSNSGAIGIDSGTATGTTGAITIGTTNASSLTIGRSGVTTTLQGSVSLTGAGTALSVTNDATISGTTTLSGDLAANGTVLTLGNAVTDGLTINAAIQGTNALIFDGSTNDTNEITLAVTDPGADFTITLPAATGTVCLTSGNCSGVGGTGDILNNGQNGTVRIGSNDANSVYLETANTDRLGISSSGDITIGTSDTTGNLLILDIKTGSGDPTGSDGAMYYNSNAGKFRCYQGGWTDCIGGGGSGVTTVGAFSGSSQTNGANISGTTITFGPADGTNPGMVSTSTQTFAGNKTFTGVVTLNGGASQDLNTGVSGGAGNALTLQPGTSTGASSNGGALTLKGGDGSGTTSVTGGALALVAGSATGGSGTRNGGSVTIDAGTGASAAGTISIGTTTATSVTIGNNTNNTAITLGSSTSTGTITVGQSTASNTISIGSANPGSSSTQTIDIGNGSQSTASSVIAVNILSGAAGSNGTATLSLGNNDRVTQIDIGNVAADAARTLNFGTGSNTVAVDTINIGTGNTTVAGGKTIHIGDGTPSGSGTNLITIGSNANVASTTAIQGGNGASAITLTPQTTGGITIGASAGTGTITLGQSTASNTINIGTVAGGSNTQTINIGTSSTASSITAITIGSSISSSSLNLKAGTGNVSIGTSDTTGTLFVVDLKTDAGDPTGTDGAIYYNTNAAKFRCYQGGWTDCIGAGGAGANTALSNLAAVAINTALLPGANNTIDLGSSGSQFRTAYLATSVITPLVQTADSAGASTAIVFRSGNTTAGSGLSTGAVTIKSGDGSGTNTSSGNVSIDSGAFTGSGTPGTVSIGTGNTASITIGNSTNNSAVTINSGTGTISIGTGAQARTVNIGTGGAAQAVTVGSSSGSSSLSLQGGSNGVNIGTAGIANTIQIGNTSGAVSQTINVGTNATGSSVTSVVIGSTIGSSAVSIRGGTGGVGITANANITLGTSDTTGTLLVLDTKTDTGDPTGVAGGIYYNSNSGKFRCYQGSGWRDCLSGSATGTYRVSLVPEFSGAVLQADGSNNSGTMTAGYGSSHNYYQWTTDQTGTAQDYDIYVRFQLPSDFNSTNEFKASSWRIWGYSSARASTTETITLIDASATTCISAESFEPGSDSTWAEATLSTNPNTACTFAANDIVTMRITVSSQSSAQIRVGEVRFEYDQ